jgi:ABC-2 type transport system ATP-binding protein
MSIPRTSRRPTAAALIGEAAGETPSGPRRDPSAPAIRVRGLRRTYGHGPSAYEAVRGIDLDVPTGSITALLGTNGAGKTSTLEVLEGLAPATGGEVSVLGLDPVADRAALRPRTGILLQRSGFSGDLTVRETLRQWSATLTSPRPVDEMLGLLSLEERADVRMLALSGGETRRVDLAGALMGRPELVILDEPTTGLDPESRREVWRLVSDLRDDGATVLLTTHYLEEAETLAERLDIMHGGRIVRSGTPREIATGYPATISFAYVPDVPGDLAGIRRVIHGLGRTTVETDALQRSLSDLLAWAAHNDVALDDLDARSPSLETVFLSIADGRDPADSPVQNPPTHAEGAPR